MPQRLLAFVVVLVISSPLLGAGPVDQVLRKENASLGVSHKATPPIDDLSFLRRASIDIAGRIPSSEEVAEFLAWPLAERRSKLIEKLISSDRFADRWTVFFGDMLRLRSNAAGGAALTAYVHQALQNDMPYDQLARRLISTNGKANNTPEVGFILGDNVDPYALASVTSQVFMGVRIGCAQCHDHPFDVWTRKDFYGVAAYFGKTRRVESNLTRVVYTTEANQTTILWPPEDDAKDGERKPMAPRFPFEMIPKNKQAEFIQRFERLVAARQKKIAKTDGPSVDDLLAETAVKARERARGNGGKGIGVTSEAKKSLRKIDVKASLYRHSEMRSNLADLITSPRNRLFARSMVNRVWTELIGRGFVEPVDDFRADNQPSHPRTLDFLAEEFVAQGYNFRNLVRMIVSSEAYQRGHVAPNTDDLLREELETAFLATPSRRMLSESLYDSVVVAGHLFDYKYPAGHNKRVVTERVRVLVEPAKPGKKPAVLTQVTEGGDKPAMKKQMVRGGGYALEDAIELDFKALLAKTDGIEIERMQVMSKEELEAQRMMQERARLGAGAKYETRMVKREFDDNPKFNSSYRMAAPAPAGHFLRVFGQTSRADLGEKRDGDPTMRQALMMLNGRLTHEASRVGPYEPIQKLVAAGKIEDAIELAYLEILTRKATPDEMADAKSMIKESKTAFDGIADLRWVLLNCNEFRFLP